MEAETIAQQLRLFVALEEDQALISSTHILVHIHMQFQIQK